MTGRLRANGGNGLGKLRDSLAFVLGAFILVFETVARERADVALVVAGFACLGVTGSGVAQRWIEAKFPSDPPPDRG